MLFLKSQNYDVVSTNYVVVFTNVVVVSTNYDVVLTTHPFFSIERTVFPYRKNGFLCQRERLKNSSFAKLFFRYSVRFRLFRLKEREELNTFFLDLVFDSVPSDAVNFH